VVARDDDGISGGVTALTLTLDGRPLAAGTERLDEALFRGLGLPTLGCHTIEVRAVDRAGNATTRSVTFEVVLMAPVGTGLLAIDADSVCGHGETLEATFSLPCSPTGSALDPTYSDVVRSTLRLAATATGRQAAPSHVQVDAARGRLKLRFERCDLAGPGGQLGERFVLTGRFFSTTGPAFSAADEVCR